MGQPITTTPDPRGEELRGDLILLGCVLFLLILLFIVGLTYCLYRRYIEKNKKEKFHKKPVDLSFLSEDVQYNLDNDTRLRVMIERCRRRVLPPPVGERIHSQIPARRDPRRPPGAHASIVLMDEDCNHNRKMMYLRRDPHIKRLKGTAMVQKIITNKRKYMERGPPVIWDMQILDLVAVDSFPRYLYNIYVISKDELEEMERFMNPTYPKQLMDWEYSLLTTDFHNVQKYWNFTDRQAYLAKNIHRKKNKRALYEFLNSDETSEFELLIWFYELYPQYVDSFEIKVRHLQRLPLQGLLLLAMRDDMKTNMVLQLKILCWFKLLSFALLRMTDLDVAEKKAGIMYPMNCMIKLRKEHHFDVINEAQINVLESTLGRIPVRTKEDWQIKV